MQQTATSRGVATLVGIDINALNLTHGKSYIDAGRYIAGAAMAFSSIFIVSNRLRLRRFSPRV